LTLYCAFAASEQRKKRQDKRRKRPFSLMVDNKNDEQLMLT
jgi:hypothetical protein